MIRLGLLLAVSGGREAVVRLVILAVAVGLGPAGQSGQVQSLISGRSMPCSCA